MDNRIFYTCRSCGKWRKLEKVGPQGHQCPECRGGTMYPPSDPKGGNKKIAIPHQGKPNRRKVAGKGGRRKTWVKKVAHK
jgi:DNA-directed RNA polymerase subunit RPC12/RpoP